MQKLLLAALGVGALLGTVFYKLQDPPAVVATASVVSTQPAGQPRPVPLPVPETGTGGSGR